MEKWITLAIPPTPGFLSFCYFNLAKHQTLDQSSSFTSWRSLEAGTTVDCCWDYCSACCVIVVPPSLAKSLSFCCHQNDLSYIKNLIVSPLLEIYGLLIVFRIKKSKFLVWKITYRDLASYHCLAWSCSSFPRVFYTPDILTTCISLNVPCCFYATEHRLLLFPGMLFVPCQCHQSHII